MAADHVDIAGVAPLTPVQSGMVFHTLREPHNGIYIVQYSCVISGPLDASRLRSAWSATVHAHAALRTVFVFEGLDEPLQVVRSAVNVPWSEQDWSSLDTTDLDGRFTAFLSDDRAQGFDLARAPLIRLVLIRLSDSVHRFVWTYHHAIADGWSSVLVMDEVWKRYHNPDAASDTKIGLGFLEFSHWLAKRSSNADERYWTDRLNGADVPSRLGFALPSEGLALHDRRTRVLDKDASKVLRAFATQHRLTLNTVVHGAWSVVLAACSGLPEVVYGATMAGRPSAFPHADTIVGPFISTLPMRVNTTSPLTMVDWLREIQEQLLGLREHEIAALSDVARWNGVSGSDLFETLLVFESAPESAPFVQTSDNPVARLSIAEEEYFDQSSYAFAALVHPKDAIELHAVFRQDYITGEAAEYMLELLAETLEKLYTNADAPVAQLVGPTQHQRRMLLGSFSSESASPVDAADASQDSSASCGSSGPDDVLRGILNQARKTPSAAAIVTPTQEWNYAELAREIHRLRGLLQSIGVGEGDRIGVLAPKGPEFLGGALASLAVRASYVPLDPAYPDTQLHKLISAGNVRAILVLESKADPDRLIRLGADPRTTVALSAPIVLQHDVNGDHALQQFLHEQHAETDTGDDQREAYVMFTSGSTGDPKGVRVSRSNLAHSTAARNTVYGTTPPRFLVLSPIGFDSSVAGFIWPLTVGGAVVMVPPDIERDPVALGQSIAQLGVTTTLCIPSLYRLILEGAAKADLATLHTVIVAGEACPPDLVHEHTRLLPNTALYNEYGPTECTVWSTYARLDEGRSERTLPIGRPIPGTIVRVLDPAGRLSPLGVPGELHVGGAGVALGYLNAHESHERFVPDTLGPVGARLYRTGDRVRMAPNGVLYFMGRIDEQIKIRGFRIEPGEVEAALLRVEAVSETVVVAMGQSGWNHVQLTACYSTHSGKPLDANALRAKLAANLPAHMVPSSFTHLAQLPRTRRGKVDKGALRAAPPREASPVIAPADRPADETDVVGTLGILWRQLLGGDSEGHGGEGANAGAGGGAGTGDRGDTGRSGFHLADSFFEVGGDSLLAIRLLGQIRNRWDADVAMSALYDNPSLDSMSRYIQSVLWARASSKAEAEHSEDNVDVDCDFEELEF